MEQFIVANKAHQPVINMVYHIIFYQILLVSGFLLLIFTLKNSLSAFSALAGAVAYCLPTFIFARSIAACASAQALPRFMLAFFAGEFFKLILSGVLFIFAVNYFHLLLGDAVLGLLSAIIAFWIASITCLYKKNNKLGTIS